MLTEKESIEQIFRNVDSKQKLLAQFFNDANIIHKASRFKFGTLVTLQFHHKP